MKLEELGSSDKKSILRQDFQSSQRFGRTELKNFSPISQDDVQRLKLIEGDCKIDKTEYLEISYIKGIFLGILVCVSVVGLLLLKYFVSLRAKIFYSKAAKEHATHVYVVSTDQHEQICAILQVQFESEITRFFTYKKLKYHLLPTSQVIKDDQAPLALDYSKELPKFMKESFLANGLSAQQVKNHENYYGLNEHRVEVPGYFEYLFDVMTKPFFIFQYVVSIVYILKKSTIFGILLMVFSWLTTSINYYLLWRSYNKVKETAEKEFPVTVIRSGAVQQILNVHLVPGDIYRPEGQIPCDSVILQGNLFVNEANLTGEDRPIAKTYLTEAQFTSTRLLNRDSENHWIFQGSKIETKKGQILALAVNVGFATQRGRIIRKILSKNTKQPQFFRKLIYFLCEVLFISIIVYFASLKYITSIDIQKIMVVFQFLDFITYSFPAPFPIFFNLVYAFCLERLNRDGIVGTQPQKTVQGGRLKTICFDKTGTLTHNQVKIDYVYHFKSETQKLDVTEKISENPLISGLFGCCNSVDTSSGVAKGDEIDVAMFNYVNGRTQESSHPSYKRSFCIGSSTYKLIELYPYKSEFASMSALVSIEEKGVTRYYIFAKGSPERIFQNSNMKFKGFEDFIRKISLEEGYRTIGYSFKEINSQNLEAAKRYTREQHLQDTCMLGIVCFINSLKSDARSTVSHLTQNEISTKIITGDNIFLGIKTAIDAGMIPQSAVVLAVQGSKCKGDSAQLLKLERSLKGQLEQTKINVQKLEFRDQPNLYYAIDNDFINSHKESFLHPKIKVFARISPENKALVVKQHKKIYKNELDSRPFLKRHFGQCGLKVGMVGDGANDLIAIKQADVGIGIAEADAVYSAAFAVKQLAQIQTLIMEAKNAERQIIDIVQYYGVAQLLTLSMVIILIQDATFQTSKMQIYKNFAITLFLSLFLGLSRKAGRLVKYFTPTNFMGLEHHLIYWGNTIIFTGGLVASYQYYSNTDHFIQNPKPVVTFKDGYFNDTASATITFLASNIIFIFMSVIVYHSDPWKEPFYKNWPFSALFVLNVVLIIPMYFFTDKLLKAGLQPIGRKEAGIVLAIMVGAVILVFIYNTVIRKFKLHEAVYHQHYQKREEEEYVKVSDLELRKTGYK